MENKYLVLAEDIVWLMLLVVWIIRYKYDESKSYMYGCVLLVMILIHTIRFYKYL